MKKVTIFVFLLLIVALLSGCVNIFSIPSYTDQDKYLIGNQEYEGELDTLDINWLFGKVKLIEDENATKIIVREENELPDTLKVHSYFVDGKLYIKFGEAGYKGSGIKSSEKSLEITYKSLKNINIELTSGAVYADKINADVAKIGLTSGSVNVDTLNVPTIIASITSGKFSINNLSANDATFKMTSGSINVDSSYIDKLNCELSSGSCNFNLKSCKDATFKATSGTITLTIPDDIKTKITLNKTSGGLRTQKTFTRVDKEYTFGPMDADINSTITINMTSGSVVIK